MTKKMQQRKREKGEKEEKGIDGRRDRQEGRRAAEQHEDKDCKRGRGKERG